MKFIALQTSIHFKAFIKINQNGKHFQGSFLVIRQFILSKNSLNQKVEQLKVVCFGKDSGSRRVPASRGHRDKRIDEYVSSILIEFNREKLSGV